MSAQTSPKLVNWGCHQSESLTTLKVVYQSRCRCRSIRSSRSSQRNLAKVMLVVLEVSILRPASADIRTRPQLGALNTDLQVTMDLERIQMMGPTLLVAPGGLLLRALRRKTVECLKARHQFDTHLLFHMTLMKMMMKVNLILAQTKRNVGESEIVTLRSP